MLRTKRNGDAIGILCGVTGCNKVYADVFPALSLVMVYSRHYKRAHSTPISLEQFSLIGLYAFDGAFSDYVPSELRCACDLACLTIKINEIVLTATHTLRDGERTFHEEHRNVWGIEEAEQLCSMLGIKPNATIRVSDEPERMEKAS